jgi:glycosyltransferase involved in cell wall biosynthesis
MRARRDGAAFAVTPFTHLGEDGDDSIRRFYTMPHQIDLLRSADAVFYQTRIEAQALRDRGVPERALRRGGVGIDPDEASGGNRAGFREAFTITGTLVTFLGTLAYDKGAQHVVEAAERLWAAGFDVSVALGGAAMSGFDRWFESRPAATRNRVIRLGHVVGEAKRDLLAATDVFCMPSRTDSFGIVYLEAWAAGHPVIGAAAGGVREVIRDGEDGLLVPFGDAAAIARAIERLSEPETAARMARNGRKRALREYTWDAVAGRVEAVYKDMLSR